MSEINKTYRIRTDIGEKLTTDYITLDANLVQDYDTFDILSVKIDSVNTYKLHNANYGIVVGRVLANNGFGIPNAKLSIFIEADSDDGEKLRELYPFSSTASKNRKGVRYNLLPDEQVDDCHQIVGTFPNKRYALDNDVILEVFDKYYKYTTRTNNAGDYLIAGVPVGTHTLHMDLDLSDCGILSQRPRDFVYKGYTVEQFENPNMFKTGTTYSNLSQVFSQDQVVNVQPFWGNSSLGEKIGITRADINVAFKFEPTCVFIGSVVSDNSSQGISKKCIATENMGNMEELVTGEGTIEMIRKTPSGAIEEFQVKGTQLIDGNGIWCYQIPMNLDYMMTDEYGNMVPTDNPEKGIPTRTTVRFRISMQDNEENVDNYFRAKVLVPHNPQNLDNSKHEDYDYEFGSLTRDDSFRDLFWNNVYSVKSYIPRFQKRKVGGWKEKKFTGIKNCNFYGSNNPMPYNNIRIKLPFMFTVMCAIIKVFIFIVSIMNSLTSMLGNFLSDIGNTGFFEGKLWEWLGIKPWYPFGKLYGQATKLSMNVIKEGLCPDLENWYFAPMFRENLWSPPDEVPSGYPKYDLLRQTLEKIRDASEDDDEQSIDFQNNEEMDSGGEEPVCLTIHTDYLIACVEMNLAMEYRVINFDFYNDWVNGTIYFPRFMRYIRPKKKFLGITFVRSKVKGCMDDTKIFAKTRRYTQQCALGFKNRVVNESGVFTDVENPLAKKKNIKIANNFHRQRGLSQKTIFGKNGGICHEHATMKGQHVYYMKPCEWTIGTTPNARKVNLFATDIILLGTLNDCDLNGVPQAFKYLSSTSYIMPTNLALTNMENNGYLYATGKGVICAGKSQLSETDIKKGDKINIVNPNNGLTTEILAFSGAQDSNYDVQYEDKELSDIIALTEAAGVAWNYTGPGQGEMNPEKFYYPGGHFLGLSCVNSQTNIKSCINLSRICEVGANMSQRKEDISFIDGNGNITYTYTAPTGFISGDDIVGGNFRAMFATMNYNRLLATKTSPTTGYKMYDFNFVKPINFDGAFRSVTNSSASKTLYNGPVEIPKEDTTIWEKIGIDYNSDSRPDYDNGESAHTQTRTIEDTSLDYYLYRFGLRYDELKKTNQKHQRRFLVTDGNKMYLPQYENSYYFYFGLKNGATALDEFNKQFFSECENNMLLEGEPSVDISIDGEIEICKGLANINVITSNLEVPYQSIEITSDATFMNNLSALTIINNDEEEEYDEWLTSYMFTLSGCNFGTYNITIRDANDVIFTKTEKIGMDIISFESSAYDFNTINYNKDTNDNDLKFRGGYIEISNVKIDGINDDAILTVFVKGGDSKTFNNGANQTEKIKVDKPGEYKLYVKYNINCEDGTTPNNVEMLMQVFTIRDNGFLNLYIGDSNIKANEMTPSIYGPSTQWWKKMGDDDMWIERISTFNETPINKRGEEISSIRVYAVGGSKAVWGHSQNDRDINTDVISNSEDIATWGDGYILDDEYVYYPTYNYNGKEITHFSAIAYNGTMVMGDYVAKLKNGVVSGISNNKMTDGYGYIFKPVPDGDLQFHIYNGSFTANTQDDGVFYQSVAYPSVDRPFYAKTRFYCWQRRALEMMPSSDGGSTPTITDYEEAGKTEMKLYNGITYSQTFWGGGENRDASYVTNLSGPFKVNSDDISNITGGRETLYSGYNGDVVTIENKLISGGNSGITTYGYEIIDGAANDEFVQLSNSIYDAIDSSFGTYVTFLANEDTGNEIVGPFPVGNRGGNVKYHLKMGNSGLFEKTDEGYLYLKSGKKLLYACCTYTNFNANNTEGAPVIVKITTDDNLNNKPEKIKVMFPDTNLEGEVVNKNEVLKPKGSSKPKGVKAILEYVFKNCPEINGVSDYRIIKNNNIWEDILLNATPAEGTIYNENTFYFAYGVIEGENDTKLYKIYPNPIRITEPTAENLASLVLKVDPTSITLPYVGQSRAEVSVISYRQDKWSARTDYDWITIEINGDGNKAIISVSENSNYSRRNGEVEFYYPEDTENSETAILTVIQTEYGIVFPEEEDPEGGGDNGGGDNGSLTHPINSYWTTLNFNEGGSTTATHEIGGFDLSTSEPKSANIYLPPLYLHSEPNNADSDVLDNTFVTIEMIEVNQNNEVVSNSTVLSNSTLSSVNDSNISMPTIYLEDASLISYFYLSITFNYTGVYEGDDRATYIEMHFIDDYATYEFLS